MSRSGLPSPSTQLTSFVGRERERAEVIDLLRSRGTRLLTLTGTGGVGKTRLALQAAAELVASFGDDIWFVELAPLQDGSLVVQSVAAAAGVRDQAGRSPLEMVAESIADRAVLLLLDNCEHLVDACARLVEQLLRICPALVVLATSREPLRIPGEIIYRVPSLEVPDLTRPPTVEQLTRSAAATLFIERAAAALPGFNATDKNAAAIGQICAHLDGIPLAIELAAARVRLLPVEQIAARLDDRFRLLTGGVRTALPRQQTLRALIDWSYDLLTDEERALFDRLSVFAGGFSLEAA